MRDGAVLGRWLRNEALDAMEARYEGWLVRYGRPALCAVAESWEVFSSDQVWEEIVNKFDPQPPERRVIGVLMRWGARKGIIWKTEITAMSRIAECHRRPKALWASNIFVGASTSVAGNSTTGETGFLEASPLQVLPTLPGASPGRAV